jgi:hypothetical protein
LAALTDGYQSAFAVAIAVAALGDNYEQAPA